MYPKKEDNNYKMNENKLYDNFFHKIILVQKVN